jgi:hypothetical protein
MKLTEEQRRDNDRFYSEHVELLKQSNGKTKIVVTDHELHGVTPEMWEWAWYHADTEFYRLWHPAHIAWEWERDPKNVGRYGSIHGASETIGGLTFVFRNRYDDPNKSPIPLTLGHGLLFSVLAPDDTIVMQIVAEWEAAPYGLHH